MAVPMYSPAPESVTCVPSVVTSVTPVYTYAEVAERTGLSVRTLQRYWAQLQDRHVLTASYDEEGVLRFSEEDVAFIIRFASSKSETAREGISSSQRERIGYLTASAGMRRRDAEAVRRELRAQFRSGQLLTMASQVKALLAVFPGLRRCDPMLQVATFGDTYFGTTDLLKLLGFGVSYDAVGREFRR